MRAWRVHELGEPEAVMRLEHVDPPEPGPGQLSVAVAVAAVNFGDILVCRGEYQEKPAFPFTPGMELAGTVVAVGEGVEGFAPGQRVVGSPVLGCGALAERTLVPAVAALTIPDDMAFEPASALQVTYQTGWAALHHRARLQPGETLVVHAGAGGVGSAAIQLGLAAGARVIATAGGADKVQICRTLGAEIAIDYRDEDFVPIVNEATGGEGADVIYDPVGGEVFERSTKCIAFEGRILVIGFASGRFPEVRANHMLVKNYGVLGFHWGLYARKRPGFRQQVHDELVRMHGDGRIRPVISQVVEMSDAPHALAAVAGRDSYGKVLVRVA